jgi:iron complex transport system ATP-binding protein
MPENPILSTEQLCFSHGQREAVKDISLDFCPGRHYVLAGPNGAGKSTLLDLLSSLIKPHKGQIQLMGRNLSTFLPPKLARIIALAPQNSNFNFAFTVREVVKLGRRPYLGRFGRLEPEDERIVEEALSKLHLDHLAEKPVTTLSGGEAQRVVLARTLAQATPIVLLDEPTSNLDVAQALDFMEIIKELAGKGVLLVTVSHDLSLAATYAQEIIFLVEGKIVAAGPREKTLTPELLTKVFDAEAAVRPDEFTNGLTISFRRTRAQG